VEALIRRRGHWAALLATGLDRAGEEVLELDGETAALVAAGAPRSRPCSCGGGSVTFQQEALLVGSAATAGAAAARLPQDADALVDLAFWGVGDEWSYSAGAGVIDAPLHQAEVGPVAPGATVIGRCGWRRRGGDSRGARPRLVRLVLAAAGDTLVAHSTNPRTDAAATRSRAGVLGEDLP
jgi:hypothetical protein